MKTSTTKIAGGIQAIDIHVHLRDEVAMRYRASEIENLRKVFAKEPSVVSIDDLAAMYRSKSMMAVLVNTTDKFRTQRESVPNSHIAACVEAHPDVFFGFGAIDPHAADALEQLAECVELGLSGIGELNPARQGFVPSDPSLEPVWSATGDAGLAVMFHTGFSASAAGTPGGSGQFLDLLRPIPHLDRIAGLFPQLTIIGAHPGWPFLEENLAVARHKANYFVDLSGWPPRHLPHHAVKIIGSVAPNKFLFGTDWPNITLDRWMSEFDQLDIEEDARRKILLENSRDLLRKRRDGEFFADAR